MLLFFNFLTWTLLKLDQVDSCSFHFFSNGHLCMVLDRYYWKEFHVYCDDSWVFIIGLTYFILNINDLPVDDICGIVTMMIMMLLFTLSVIVILIWGTNSKLTYETLWSGKGSSLLISMLGKLNLFYLINNIKIAKIAFLL